MTVFDTFLGFVRELNAETQPPVRLNARSAMYMRIDNRNIALVAAVLALAEVMAQSRIAAGSFHPSSK